MAPVSRSGVDHRARERAGELGDLTDVDVEEALTDELTHHADASGRSDSAYDRDEAREQKWGAESGEDRAREQRAERVRARELAASGEDDPGDGEGDPDDDHAARNTS
jgi:hypothetical protein